jgi:hypothetical protein
VDVCGTKATHSPGNPCAPLQDWPFDSKFNKGGSRPPTSESDFGRDPDGLAAAAHEDASFLILGRVETSLIYPINCQWLFVQATEWIYAWVQIHAIKHLGDYLGKFMRGDSGEATVSLLYHIRF